MSAREALAGASVICRTQQTLGGAGPPGTPSWQNPRSHVADLRVSAPLIRRLLPLEVSADPSTPPHQPPLRPQ